MCSGLSAAGVCIARMMQFIKSVVVNLFAMSVYCLMRSLLKFVSQSECFLLVCFKSSLYILDNRPLSDVCFANIFYQSVACFLIFFLQRHVKFC